ncbi:hypothetical protein RHS04_01595 [Rhizoctonia solani]|uniref:Uncharacterized protein n=1 Tax=Rhizoctonia solani TaxID=456999 RepID=A0A8H7LQS8_9AGAM|nr:hypothetical protein RHS04_01595 [Rhizoctonia solani]
MSDTIIPAGKYYLVNVASGSYAGVGPIPPIYPPFPSPLKAVGHVIKEPFTLEPKGEGKYIITHKALRLPVVYDDEGIVRLARQGQEKGTEWVIVRGYRPDRYRIKTDKDDLYWTVGEQNWDPIKVEAENNDSSQEWRFEEAHW